MMIRTVTHEIAVCLIGAVTVAMFLASPVVAWFLIAGLRRLWHSYPP